MSFGKYVSKVLALGCLLVTTFTFKAYAQNIATVTDDNINVRSQPSINGEVLFTLKAGEEINIVSIEGDWAKVEYTNQEHAYIAKQFLKVRQAAGAVNSDQVNVRALASTDSEIVGSLSMGTEINITGIMGEFFSFEHNGSTAFIHKDFVNSDAESLLGQSYKAVQLVAAALPQSVYALVTSGDGVNLRSEPSQNSQVLAKIPFDDVMDILDAGEQWNRVSYNGTEGYVNSDFIIVKTGVKPDRSLGTKIVEYGKKFIGTPYVWGGTNLRTGVDCSGFVYAVMRDNGIYLSRSSREQVNDGTIISKDQLKAGDLVFFDTNGGSNNGNISHVGIYMGGGQFIHSSSSPKSYYVTISSLNEDYYIRNYVTACRVIK